jgi:3-hydroxyacyl-[acyl-carrier-protein] dehydratase
MEPIGIKYCGGCNPLIDRPGLVREIEKLLQPGLRLVADMTSTPWEIGILVCGCPIACVERPDVQGISKHWIRVSGTSVDLDPIQEDKMAAVIVEKIYLLQTKR